MVKIWQFLWSEAAELILDLRKDLREREKKEFESLEPLKSWSAAAPWLKATL